MSKSDPAVDAVFNPRRIAVLGASADPSKFGSQVLSNLLAGGFPGELYPVSRSITEVAGLQAYASLRALPAAPDLVLISVPVQHVASAVEDAVAAFAKAAVIFTAGFQEVGAEGRAIQQEVVRRAAGKLRLIGPNCLGVRNFHRSMNASPVSKATLPAGPIAFVSQSGAFGNAAMAGLEAARTGMSKLASVGNMADLTHAELFQYLAHDDETSVVAAFVEGVRDVPAFLNAVSYLSRLKPVVILKGGMSKSGQRAALSHTGSMAGDGRVWQALLREAGANVAASSEELFDVAAAFARNHNRSIAGRRAAIFSLAGGPAVVAADHCDAHGIDLPPLEDQLASLRAIVPSYAALGNPVEVTGQTKREHLAACAEMVISQPNVDALVGIAIGLDFNEFAAALIAANNTKPVVSCVVAPNSETILAEAGVANFPSVDRAVRAMHHLMERGTRQSPEALPAVKVQANPIPRGVLSEAESKAYLSAYGLPITGEAVVTGADAAIAAADRMGYPVAIKVSSAAIAHKSDVGGVVLNLPDADAVRNAVLDMDKKFPLMPVLVQQMVNPGLELIVGARRTPETGVVVMLGIGGVLTEILNDAIFFRAPASVATATDALNRLGSQRLLNGYRGAPAIDRDAVARIAATLSQIVAANPDIVEVDLNPVIAHSNGAVVVDALIRTEA
jgi:acetyltransferase